MPLLGLIGYPLSHSFSPAYFREKFKKLGFDNWDYKPFPIASLEMLPDIIQLHPELAGFNVTIPYKESILSYCNTLSPEVSSIGAANCILVLRQDKNYSLEAFNTDYIGFVKSIEDWYKPTRKKALVLGTGGASKAIQYALSIMEISYDVAGRGSPLNYHNIRLGQYDLIVNCTPIGMQGFHTDSLDLPFHETSEGTYFVDLVYNPAQTSMMNSFAQYGAIAQNGERMLHAQADKAWEIFYKA